MEEELITVPSLLRNRRANYSVLCTAEQECQPKCPLYYGTGVLTTVSSLLRSRSAN